MIIINRKQKVQNGLNGHIDRYIRLSTLQVKNGIVLCLDQEHSIAVCGGERFIKHALLKFVTTFFVPFKTN